VGDIGVDFGFWAPQIPGTLYLKAQSPLHIQRAFERVHTVYTNRDIILVPQRDCDELYQMNRPVPVRDGDWVRVKKKGLYKDDVGYVLTTDLLNSSVTVLLLPRISYAKDRLDSAITRPPPAPFDHNRARSVFGLDSVKGDDAAHSCQFQQMSFQGGLLKSLFPLRHLVTRDVQPTYRQIEKLYSYLMTTTPSWDWSRDTWYRGDYLNSLCVGDRVRVQRGEGTGQVGHVVDVKEYGVMKVLLTAEMNTSLRVSGDLLLEIPVDHTVRVFQVGDYIRVRHGIHTGVRGYVIEFSEMTLKVVALQSDNLELSDTVSSPESGFFLY
jgi:ribosomal protein L24